MGMNGFFGSTVVLPLLLCVMGAMSWWLPSFFLFKPDRQPEIEKSKIQFWKKSQQLQIAMTHIINDDPMTILDKSKKICTTTSVTTDDNNDKNNTDDLAKVNCVDERAICVGNDDSPDKCMGNLSGKASDFVIFWTTQRKKRC